MGYFYPQPSFSWVELYDLTVFNKLTYGKYLAGACGSVEIRSSAAATTSERQGGIFNAAN